MSGWYSRERESECVCEKERETPRETPPFGVLDVPQLCPRSVNGDEQNADRCRRAVRM